MNILVCTSFDLNLPCAAINRINHLKNCLDKKGIKIFICGSSKCEFNKYSITF